MRNFHFAFVASALLILVVNCVAGAGGNLPWLGAKGTQESQTPSPKAASPQSKAQPPKIDMNSIPDLMRYLEEFTANVEVCPPGSYLPCRTVEVANSIERDEIIAALGHLHAVEAVPLLIKVMGMQNPIGLGKYSGPEVDALVEIGKPAVSELLYSLTLEEEYIQKAARSPVNDFGYGAIGDRIVEVLAEIGDTRALPVLKKLRTQTTNSFWLGTLDGAINDINRKHQKK